MSAFNSPPKNLSSMIRLRSKAGQQSSKAKVTLEYLVLELSNRVQCLENINLLLKPIERIFIDTIGPLPLDMGIKYIILIIDTFARYVERPVSSTTTIPYSKEVLSNEQTKRSTVTYEIFYSTWDP